MNVTDIFITIETNNLELLTEVLELYPESIRFPKPTKPIDADPNFADERGYTALFSAKTQEALDLLLTYGAHLNHKTDDGVGIVYDFAFDIAVLQYKILK